jgi:hypothetical protein
MERRAKIQPFPDQRYVIRGWRARGGIPGVVGAFALCLWLVLVLLCRRKEEEKGQQNEEKCLSYPPFLGPLPAFYLICLRSFFFLPRPQTVACRHTRSNDQDKRRKERTTGRQIGLQAKEGD